MKIASCLALAALLGAGAGCRRTDPPDKSRVGGGRAATVSSQRPVYPYSVIRGGVGSGKELADVLARDPVAANHYRDIDVLSLRVVKLDRDQSAYVSYRYQANVYWTRKKVRIAAGETVLAANDRPTVRARCGNRISFQPIGPTLAPHAEPAAEVLNPPDISVRPPSEWVFNGPPAPLHAPEAVVPTAPLTTQRTQPGPDHFPPAYPIIVPPAGSTGVGSIHTPEPGTFLLIGAALTVLLWRKLRPRA